MKEYKLGYISDGYIVDIIASTTQQKINHFLKVLDMVDFEDDDLESVCENDKFRYMNILLDSEDIRNEFRRIFESKTIDLTVIRNFTQSGSELCNIKFKKILEKFFELFDCKVYVSFEGKEYNKVTRMICLMGIFEDKVHYLELGNSLVGNTEVLTFSNKTNLIEPEEIVLKNKQYKLIDKID